MNTSLAKSLHRREQEINRGFSVHRAPLYPRPLVPPRRITIHMLVAPLLPPSYPSPPLDCTSNRTALHPTSVIRAREGPHVSTWPKRQEMKKRPSGGNTTNILQLLYSRLPRSCPQPLGINLATTRCSPPKCPSSLVRSPPGTLSRCPCYVFGCFTLC